MDNCARILRPVAGHCMYTHLVCLGYDILFEMWGVGGESYKYAKCGKIYASLHKMIDGVPIDSDQVKLIEPEWFTSELLALCRHAKSPIICTYELPLLFEISDIRQAIDYGTVKFNTSKSKIKTIDNDSELETNSSFITFANYPNIMILDTVKTGKEITFVDIQNYTDRDIENVAIKAYQQEPIETILDENGNIDTTDGVKMLGFIKGYMKRYCDTCKTYGLGGLRVSAGSQSMQALKMGLAAYVVTKSTDVNICDTERKAYHGGRVYACGSGIFNARCHYVDICSMYPYIGATYPMPVGEPTVHRNPSVGKLRELCDDYYTIASCYIETDKPVYPFNESTQTLYPIGSFETLLHKPEIVNAIDKNHIKLCRYALCYKSDYWLRDYCRKMLAARVSAREKGATLDEGIIKRITNAIFGKLGQRGNAWVRCPGKVHAQPYGVWWEIDPVTREHHLYRSIDFNIEKRVRNVVIHDTHFPAAGAITAYGRMILSKYHELAGANNTIYACVDGLIVNDTGVKNLMLLPGVLGNNPGQLRIVETAEHCVINRAGHYVIGDKVVNTGFRRKEQTVYSTLATIGGKQPEHWENEGELTFRTASIVIPKADQSWVSDLGNMPWAFHPPMIVHRDYVDDSELFR